MLNEGQTTVACSTHHSPIALRLHLQPVAWQLKCAVNADLTPHTHGHLLELQMPEHKPWHSLEC